jgi:uncharacterized membrane protein
MQSYIKKVLLIFAPCYGLILLALAWLLITKRISTSLFAAVGGFAYVAGFLILFNLIRKAKKKFPQPEKLDAAGIERLRRSARSFKILAAYMTCLFAYCEWTVRNSPLLPRLAGTAFAILIIGSFMRTIRRINRKIASSGAELAAGAPPQSADTDKLEE